MAAADAPAGRPTSSRLRDPALDLLRCVALARIVVWHLFAATWLTWFAAIPVMFFVAGSLLGGASRGYVGFLRRRLRRILLPLWLYSGCVAAAYLVVVGGGRPSADALRRALAWIVPVVDPTTGGWDAGWLSNHLWYLRAYLWILVLAPLLLLAAKRVRWAVTAAVAGIIGLELAARAGTPGIGSGTVRVLLGDALVYGCFAMLGIAYREHGLRLRRRTLVLVAAVTGLGAVAYARFHGLPAEGVNGSYPAVALVGAAWLAALGAVEAPLRRFAARARVQRLTRSVSSRSLTVYLWHPVCIVLARRLLPGGGFAGALAVIAGTSAFVLLVVALVGWDEAVASSSHRLPRGSLSRLKPVAGVVAVIALLGAALPTLTGQAASALAGQASTTVTTFGIPAPSARDALADAAFAAPSPAGVAAAATVPTTAPATAPTTVPATAPTTVPTTAPAAAPTTMPATVLTTAPSAPTDPPTTMSPVASDTVPLLRLSLTAATPAVGKAKAVTKTVAKVSTKTATTVTSAPASTTPRTTAPRRTVTTTAPRVAATPTTALAPRSVAALSATTAPAIATVASTAPPVTSLAATSTTAAAKAAAAPTTAPSKAAALPAQALQRALDAWRASASPKITTMIVALRSGSQTWVAKSADGVITSKYQPDAPFLAASLTKTFTAALVLREVEKGTISLDDPVPAINGLDKPVPAGITVRRLLTHTAGLVDYTAARGYRADAPLTPIQAVNLSLAMPLQDGLGSTVRYANSGYLYLGLLLEQVTGKSYASLLSGIAADAGLQNTTLDTQQHPGWIGFSSGGVVATAADLATWGQALFTPGKVLSAQNVSLLTTLGDMNLGLGTWPVCPCSTDANGVKRYTAIGHNTADGGMFYFPATGITIVAMFDPVTNDIVSLMDALNAAIKDN